MWEERRGGKEKEGKSMRQGGARLVGREGGREEREIHSASSQQWNSQNIE